MVNPQKENGHVGIANELVEALARTRLNATQTCLLWVILRKTYGWNKKMDTISLAQFADATGIHRVQCARELGRLSARHIIVEWGDDHHPKQYGIQKDYSRWVTDEKVSTKPLTPTRKVSTDQLQSVNGSVAKVSTDQLPTKDKKDKSTDSHESGTLRDRFEAKYQTASNKGAVIGELFSLLLGGQPDYRRLGVMAKELNSGGKLMDLIIDASKQRISDDPHNYLAAMVKRVKADHRPGKLGQADLNSGKAGRFVP
jgi:phage replication O-like protein O